MSEEYEEEEGALELVLEEEGYKTPLESITSNIVLLSESLNNVRTLRPTGTGSDKEMPEYNRQKHLLLSALVNAIDLHNISTKIETKQKLLAYEALYNDTSLSTTTKLGLVKNEDEE